MAYNKTTWQTGDIITADKLNNIENGISSLSNGSTNTSRVIDVDSVIQPTFGEAYTCPSDGVAVFGCWIDSNAGTAVYPLDHDDGVNYITRYANATGGRLYAYNSITVNKGQVICPTSAGTSGDTYFKFYPYKEIEV